MALDDVTDPSERAAGLGISGALQQGDSFLQLIFLSMFVLEEGWMDMLLCDSELLTCAKAFVLGKCDIIPQ